MRRTLRRAAMAVVILAGVAGQSAVMMTAGLPVVVALVVPALCGLGLAQAFDLV
jgi:hypothetical protein